MSLTVAFLTFALEAATCLTGVVAIVACASLWRRTRSRISSWLLVGAAGQTLMWLGLLVVGWANVWTGTHHNSGVQLARRFLLLQQVAIGILILGFCSALVFSISLMLVLRNVNSQKIERSIHGGSTP